MSLSSLCNWVLWSASRCVFWGTNLSAERAGSTLQREKKGTVAIQSAFIGKSAYSRKNTSADSSACASLTCESGAYSVILWQKGWAQRGTLVYLTAFHYALLHQPRSFYYSVAAAYRRALKHRYGATIFESFTGYSTLLLHWMLDLGFWFYRGRSTKCAAFESRIKRRHSKHIFSQKIFFFNMRNSELKNV